VITAADYRHIMKIAFFALDGIFEELWNQITCDELCDLYANFGKMYMMSRKESYTENELKNFEVIVVSNKLKLTNFKLVNKFLINTGNNY
jgi:hypothetical protein